MSWFSRVLGGFLGAASANLAAAQRERERERETMRKASGTHMERCMARAPAGDLKIALENGGAVMTMCLEATVGGPQCKAKPGIFGFA